MHTRKVLLGMSGGVDSSVAAHLLSEAGYRVTGLWLRLHDQSSPSSDDGELRDAQQVAEYLHLPFLVVDAIDDFRKRVIEYFCAEFKRGRTPSPCIVCNEHIKFRILHETARTLGIPWIATGHYAVIQYDDSTRRYSLRKGFDHSKEQSYMLFSLGQTILSRTIFPLGSFTKERVRELAVRIGLPTSRKKDSQEICFIGERSYNDYLLRSGAVRPRPGLLIDRHGRTVGTHNGVHNFTIGQRRGLCGGQKYPLYVKQIVPEHRVVVVARRDQLYSLGAIIRDVNWVSVSRIDGPTRTNVMLRYRQSEAKAVITPCAKEAYFLRFSQPQWAVTPGQAAVLYDGNAVLGGGWIDEALYELPADTA